MTERLRHFADVKRGRALMPVFGKRPLPQIDLGKAPPSVQRIYQSEPGHTSVSARLKWLASTCLAGVVSMGLIGMSLYASIDMDDGGGVVSSIKRASLAALEPAAGVQIIGEEQTVARGKGDRLQTTSLGLSTRHIIHDSVVQQRHNREYIRIKPYVRIVARLATSQPEDADTVPPFNPFKLYADTTPISQNADESASEAAVKRDVDVRVIELVGGILPDEDGVELRTHEVTELVTEANEFFYGAPFLMNPVIRTDGEGAIHTASYHPDDFASTDLIENEVPRNTTAIEKTRVDETDEIFEGSKFETVRVKRGDTLTNVLRDTGAEPWLARTIAQSIQTVFSAKAFRAGQEVRFTLVPAPSDTGQMEPIKVSIFEGSRHKVTVARNQAGDYIASDDPIDLADAASLRQAQYPQRATLYQSIYQSALGQQISAESILRLMRIHSYDTDYKQRVQAGDSFEAFFDLKEDAAGHDAAPRELLYTSITVDDETRQFYRYRTPDGGVDYYDQHGDSAKKFLMRKPVKGARFTSSFGMRRHPVNHRRKMHTGTDWAAPRGTPILAAGNGSVEAVGRKGGYGNYVRIRHANGYKTAYGHMARFAPGMRPGVKVRQGQIIGFVGSTGLSSGPHLHFEVLVNSRHVNPMRIHVPRGRKLTGRELAEFKKERTRIDELLRRSPVNTQVASMN